MRFWVGVTDREWFEYLRVLGPDEVNFWQPSSGGLPSSYSLASRFCSSFMHRITSLSAGVLRSV